MEKYFGTDGFRVEAGITLTADHAYKVGRLLGQYYNALRERNGNNEPARIVIGTVNSFAQIFSDILAEVQLYKFNGQCTSPLNINQLLLQIPLLIKLAVFKIFLLRNKVLR